MKKLIGIAAFGAVAFTTIGSFSAYAGLQDDVLTPNEIATAVMQCGDVGKKEAAPIGSESVSNITAQRGVDPTNPANRTKIYTFETIEFRGGLAPSPAGPVLRVTATLIDPDPMMADAPEIVKWKCEALQPPGAFVPNGS